MVTTRTQTEQEQSHVGSIQVRGAVQDLIHEHEASTQSTASGNEPIVEADGYVRRDDRQYPPAYDGANPGPSHRLVFARVWELTRARVQKTGRLVEECQTIVPWTGIVISLAGKADLLCHRVLDS